MGAVITRSSQTQLWAALTRVVLSGQDSFLVTNAPADGAMTISEWKWTWSDGLVQRGACVSRKFPVAASHSVTLEVTFRAGGTSSTSDTVVVAATPSFSGFKKYVDSTRPDDSGDGNSEATAYKTAAKVRDVWTSYRGASSTGFAPGCVLFRRGVGSYAATAGESWDFGPLYVGTYDTGSRPQWLFPAGTEFQLGGTNHDDLFDNPVFSDGIDYSWSAVDSNNKFNLGHVATQLEGSVVTNAEIAFAGHGATISLVEQSNGWRFGCFMSGPFLHMGFSSFTGNGHDGNLDHQVYCSAGVSRCGIEWSTADATGAVAALDGFKTSGCSKFYLRHVEAIGCKTAFDVGGNTSPNEPCTDMVYDAPFANECLHQGWWANLCSRVSIRNPMSIGGLDACVIEVQNQSTGIHGLEILDGSFSNFTGRLLRTNDTNFSGVVMKNCAALKDGTGIFFDISADADLAEITSDSNQFFRTGGTPGSDTSFALVEGVSKSFANWQASPISQDAASSFVDPLFVDPDSDLHLQAGSQCIDAGVDLGLLFDADDLPRLVGSAVDIGSFEAASSSDITGSFDKPLGSLGMSAAGEVQIKGTLFRTLGALSGSSHGLLDLEADLDTALGALQLSSQALIGAEILGEANIQLAPATVQAAGTLDVQAGLDVELGAIAFESAATSSVGSDSTAEVFYTGARSSEVFFEAGAA